MKRLLSYRVHIMLAYIVAFTLLGISLSSSNGYKKTFLIREGRPPNTFVGNLSNSILSISSIPKEFKVNLATGVITSAVTLDREQKSSYSFQLLVKDAGFVDINIKVEDVNDETPTFTMRNRTVTISEARVVGYELNVGLITDRDEGLNSVHNDSVKVLTGNVGNVFKINLKERGSSSYSVFLQIAIKLRKSVLDKYVLNISASDKGIPVLTGYLLLTVIVEDYNDCAPKFSRQHYSAVVSEAAPKTTTVLNVTTTDCDFGKNAEVRYEMDYNHDKGRYFGIKQTGNVGFIQTNLNLDYETKTQYNLRVIATDMGTNPKTSHVDVAVVVRDENDNRPEVGNFNFYSIKEDASVNTPVGSVKIEDKDSGENARLNVKLEPRNLFYIRQILNDFYNIYLNTSLDREERMSFKIIVTATDHGRPPKSSQNADTLLIGDVNDNPPKFDQSNYMKDILESEKIGYPVLSVHATDPDTVSASSITYHIVGPQSSNYSTWFGINSTSGLIYVASDVDHEMYSQVVLVVEARDGGVPEYATNCTVVLNIIDVNDNAPRFSKLYYYASVLENLQPGTFVLQVVAMDKDFWGNESIMYYFDTELPPPNNVFALNASTGSIRTLQKLDRELINEYRFNIMAEDKGGLTGLATVRVTVKDANDNPPFFKPTFYNISVFENITVGTQLVQLQAFDNDTGWNALISYEFFPENKNSAFFLDKNNGQITLKQGLDREKVDKYKLKFRAIDNGGITSKTLATVEILVLDVNDDPPVFLKKDYSFLVAENMSFVFVGTVTAKSHDQGHGGLISYSIKTSDARKFFHVNNSGSLFINLSLDYETQSKHVFTVEARDYGNPPLFGYVNVTVFVKDINDNPPHWQDHNIKITVDECQEIGDVLYTFNATDKDAGKNGQVTYSIMDGPPDVFYINPRTGSFSLLKHVDYEEVKFYTLTVNASDSGTPSLSSYVKIDVDVQDCNDNAPMLNESHVNVSEDVTVKTTIFTFHAVDKDSGDYGKVWFKLEAGVGSSNFELSREGVLRLVFALDREKRDKHELYIIAVDRGQPFKTSPRTKFTVYVKDVNDEVPTFSKRFTFTTIENAKPGTKIGRITAIDRDIGMNAKLEYTLVNTSSGFKIDSSTGILRNKVRLDREKTPVYKVEVQVHDMGQPPRSSKTVVDINVLDENDNAPKFTQNPYNVKVAENVAKGTIIAKVRALDPDAGLNGTVVYHFVAGNIQDGEVMFQVNSTTGIVYVVASLDREIKAFFVLAVGADDKGHPSQDNICNVMVTVLDVNDNKPELKSNDTVNVSEKLQVGSTVYIVNATDPDDGENGNIRYSLISSAPDDNSFNINSNSGVVTLKKALDYEQTKQYNLQIKASDNANDNPRKSILQLYVNVLDSNDNMPIFKSKSNPVHFKVTEGVKLGTKVEHPIIAVDRDSGTNGDIVYLIYSQTPKSAFKIDPSTAQLTTDVEIDREDVEEYTVVIKAVDQAVDPSERLSSTLTVKIDVVDINDCAPVFTSRSSTFVMEDEPLNYTVFMFTAEDKDSGKGGKIIFTLATADQGGIFELEPSGSLILKASLDREKTESYELNVTAVDRGDHPLSTTITFTISVEDVNDNMPQFFSHLYTVSVWENENSPKVLTAVATDADSGPRGRLFYSIPDGIADDLFVINETSGVISTSAPLDREKEETYWLTVYVRDDFYPKYTDNSTVIIHVLDKNDNAPFFVKSNYKVQVPENSPPGTLCSLVAEDDDVGINAQLKYFIGTGNDLGYFVLDEDTGIISTLFSLDREENAVYNLHVRVEDLGHPRLSATANITIEVLDENDNAPRFSTNELNASIPGNSLPGTSVTQLKALDDDKSLNMAMVYTFHSRDQVPFGMDSTTGLIYTVNYLNSSEVNKYSFVVLASDGSESGALTRSINVNIFVDNTTSTPLRFTEIFYNVSSPADVEAGFDILQVQLRNQNLKPGDVHYTSEGGQSVLAVGSTKGNVSFTAKPNSGAYVFSVRATLVRDQSNTALCFVLVTVQDSVQHPTFVKPVYYAATAENAPAGTFVTKVVAKTSGNVLFQIVNGNEFNAFLIDSNGEVKVNNASALDYERTRNFELDVKGDWGTTVTNIAFVKIYVTIHNEDDKAPVFRQNVFIFNIPESNVPQDNRIVGTLRAFHFGSSPMSFGIVSGNENNVFFLNSSTGELRLQKPVNREKKKSYNITVSVDQIKLSSKSTVLIHISDINNNSPTLLDNFAFRISENSPRGSLVGRVTAEDQDDFSVLKYSLVNRTQRYEPFFVDVYTGTLTLIGTLDYETLPVKYDFGILVTDGKFSVSTNVSVYVLDENDNKPLFEKPSYIIERVEIVPAIYHLVQVNASDKDEGDNGNVTYSMTQIKGLTIDPKTGVIWTTQALVYDPFQVFLDVVVTATDQGFPSLSANVPLRVKILDASDNPPKLENNATYDKRIPENTKIGTFLLQVKAIDSYPPYTNKRIKYKISHGDEQRKFRIEERTGKLRVRGNLDREETDQYSLLILAGYDSHDPANVAKIPVQITIDDVNDNAPVFQRNKYYTRYGNESRYETTLREDVANNITVLTVNATDRDIGRNKKVGYSISSGNDGGWFIIDNQGQIQLVNSLDRDVIPIHRLSVRARDEGEPQKSSEIAVVIKVTDINDNAPVFNRPKDLGVLENAAVGTSVGAVKATDSDSEENQLIYYSIINGTGVNLFKIKKLTGELTTAATFDYELESSFSLLIKAEDQGSPPRSSTMLVAIKILSVDEYIPEFLQDSYSFNVSGNSKKGTVLGTVQAVDRDRGPDGVVIYELVSPVEPFAVNSTSGEIYLTKDVYPYQEETSRKRRETFERTESAEATRSEIKNLTIKASSGREGSYSSTVQASMIIDYTCPGCPPTPSPRVGNEPIEGVLVVFIALGVVGFIALCVFLICLFVVCKRKGCGKNEKSNEEDVGLQLKPVKTGLTNSNYDRGSTSESNSPASGSSTSGHGFLDGGKDIEDERNGSCSESAIQIDIDSNVDFSDEKYSEVRSDRTNHRISHLESRESLYDFADEGGKEASGRIDVENLLFAKLAEADAEENDQIVDRPRVFNEEGGPYFTVSLSSIPGSREELRGHYNYFYSLNQGPQYQPLSEIFSEIARSPLQDSFKDKNLQSSSNPANDISGRTSMLSSVSSLHNQHLDVESTYSSLPMTPNFTPAITPLVTRSPSVSPLTSEAVTPMVSPSQSRPSSIYLPTTRPSSSMVQLAQQDYLEDCEDVNV